MGRIVDFELLRFQFRRDRPIGDCKSRFDQAAVIALRLIDDRGQEGLGFAQLLRDPLASEEALRTAFLNSTWPEIEGETPISLALRIDPPADAGEGGTAPRIGDALQQAIWDLAAKSAGLPLWQLLGARRQHLPAYASGLDFHLEDDGFVELFAAASELGFKAFKIKVGHERIERDLHRLDLLRGVVPTGSQIMLDPNEGWTLAEAQRNMDAIAAAGYRILWLEDPIARDDVDGLRILRSRGDVLINSGEYLNATGKRRLLERSAVDMLNVHGRISEVLHLGWFAAELGVAVTMGNTVLEVGLCAALALPTCHWVEYSFQNFEHLVDKPYAIHGGQLHASTALGHGLSLSNAAFENYRTPEPRELIDLGDAPVQQRLLTRHAARQDNIDARGAIFAR